MAADSLQVRIARLEGGYEQIDKRMGTLEDRMRELHADMRAVGARVDAVFFGVIVAILVPIFLRVFFH